MKFHNLVTDFFFNIIERFKSVKWRFKSVKPRAGHRLLVNTGHFLWLGKQSDKEQDRGFFLPLNLEANTPSLP